MRVLRDCVSVVCVCGADNSFSQSPPEAARGVAALSALTLPWERKVAGSCKKSDSRQTERPRHRQSGARARKRGQSVNRKTD